MVNDETESLTTRGDEVYLDLGVVVGQLGTAVGIDIASRIPAGVAEIDIMRADQLTAVQDGADGLEKLAYILPLIALLLLALAVYLARGWRRVAVRSAGFVLIAVGLVVLVSRGIAGNFVVDALATTAAVEPAADSVWTIGTSLLSAAAVALIGYGAVIVIGAWLAGPGSLRDVCPGVDRTGAARAPRALPDSSGDRPAGALVEPDRGHPASAAVAAPDRPADRRCRGASPPDDRRVPRPRHVRLRRGLAGSIRLDPRSSPQRPPAAAGGRCSRGDAQLATAGRATDLPARAPRGAPPRRCAR